MRRSLIYVCIVSSFLFWSGSAFALMFTLENFGSDDVTSITASATDIAGGVHISVDVGGPVIADITGVFFDLSQAVADFNPFSVDNFNYVTGDGNIFKAPNNSNIKTNNVDDFDVGVAIGDTGLGSYDYRTVMFDVFGTGLDELDITRLGVRLQSVGLISSVRGGSAKYIGDPGTGSAPVPEPTTMFLFGTGLIGLVGVARRKKK